MAQNIGLQKINPALCVHQHIKSLAVRIFHIQDTHTHTWDKMEGYEKCEQLCNVITMPKSPEEGLKLQVNCH